MRQQTLAAQASFEKYGRKSKREQFLDEMEHVVPWAELQALVEPHYPKGENGRPPVGLTIMLRVYFVQQWFNLSRKVAARCPCAPDQTSHFRSRGSNGDSKRLIYPVQCQRICSSTRQLECVLADPEEQAVEEHLLGCDACGTRLREVIALADGIRKVAREGSLRMVVSDVFLRRAVEEGLRVREYAPPAGGGVQCTVTAEDDILVGRLAANLSGVKRVDLCICNERGVEQFRLPDIGPLRANRVKIAGEVKLYLQGTINI